MPVIAGRQTRIQGNAFLPEQSRCRSVVVAAMLDHRYNLGVCRSAGLADRLSEHVGGDGEESERTETIAAGRAFARSDEPAIDANRELLATGAGNVGGALLGAMPAGGGTSQTAVVRATGGMSQRASLVTALVALATMWWLAPLLGLLPNATLATVVIVYSVSLIQPAEFVAIRKIRTMEFR